MSKALACLLSLSILSIPAYPQAIEGPAGTRHVLLISIDGMHSLDYLNCSTGISTVNSGAPYCPNLAALGQTGVNYKNTSTSKPSDSFPGLTAIVSGGSPALEGVFYDVAYDRSLAPPAKTTGNGVAAGTCTPGVLNGTRTEYEEGIDIDQTQLNGGAPSGGGGINSIDPARLPRDPMNGCAPVYPWNFVRTNTIFGVIHGANGYTAWTDKHPAYSSVSGPGDGTNVDDFYGPEINSVAVGLPGITTPSGLSCSTLPDPTQTGGDYTTSFLNIQCYDTLKVNAIINQIDSKKHDGTPTVPVPNLFGMNFQAVSVGQKLIEKGFGSGGYLDAFGTPSPQLLGEIEFVDVSIGRMVAELKAKGLYYSTVIVITAKHGQSPIDVNRFFPIPGPSGNNGTSPATLIASLLPFSESPLNPNGIGPTEDDISLLWLADSSQTANAVATIEANAAAAGVGEILAGNGVSLMFNPPGLPPKDPRSPDIIVIPKIGVVYTGSSKKLSEHGGFAPDDTQVITLVSNPFIKPGTVTGFVQTAQVAPTILQLLGLNPRLLQAVQKEGTPELPGIQFQQ